MSSPVFDWQENREESLLCRPDWLADNDSFERFCELDEYFRMDWNLNYDFVEYDDIIDNCYNETYTNSGPKNQNVLTPKKIKTEKSRRIINNKFIPLQSQLSKNIVISERKRILEKTKWTKELLSAYIDDMREYFNIESCRRWQVWHYANNNGGAVIAQFNYDNNKQEVEVIIEDDYTLYRILGKNKICEAQVMLYDYIKSRFNKSFVGSDGLGKHYLIEANDDNLFMSVYRSFGK